MEMMHQTDETLVQKWEPVLEGIDNDYTRRVTAQLLENQAKSIVEDKVRNIDEAISAAATTTGQLGTFQKFAFPLVRRVYPQLLANSLVGVQPMQGPVSQVFYLGNSRARNGGGAVADNQTVFSKFNLTYAGNVAQQIGSASGTGTERSTGPGLGGAQGTFVDKDGVQIPISPQMASTFLTSLLCLVLQCKVLAQLLVRWVVRSLLGLTAMQLWATTFLVVSV
jgi:hypothetical protein